MISHAEYFSCFESLAMVTGRMLVAARAALWDELDCLQSQYCCLIQRLKKLEGSVCLDEAECRRKYRLFRQILADDAEIYNLAHPTMASVYALMAGRSNVNSPKSGGSKLRT